MMNGAEYNFCTQCGAKVARESFFCTVCGHRLSVENIPSADGIYEKAKAKKGMSKGEKMTVTIAAILPFIMAIIVFCSIYLHQTETEKAYTSLKEAMNIGDKGLYEVAALLEELPDDYRDVKKIRYEYEKIEANISILSQEDLTPRGASFSRRVLKTLREIEEKNSAWEITDYVLQRYTEHFVFNGDWINGTHYFIWTTDPTNTYDYVATSLPGNMMNMDPNTYYYERTDKGLILGYCDPETGKRIAQYEVLNIIYVDDNWCMEILCCDNGTIYSFEAPYLAR